MRAPTKAVVVPNERTVDGVDVSAPGITPSPPIPPPPLPHPTAAADGHAAEARKWRVLYQQLCISS